MAREEGKLLDVCTLEYVLQGVAEDLNNMFKEVSRGEGIATAFMQEQIAFMKDHYRILRLHLQDVQDVEPVAADASGVRAGEKRKDLY